MFRHFFVFLIDIVFLVNHAPFFHTNLSVISLCLLSFLYFLTTSLQTLEVQRKEKKLSVSINNLSRLTLLIGTKKGVFSVASAQPQLHTKKMSIDKRCDGIRTCACSAGSGHRPDGSLFIPIPNSAAGRIWLSRGM